MNSSGIKRGLAATAISAMAVTGLPLLASSASADVTDVIQVESTGPALNGGGEGAVVVLNTQGVDPANLELKGTDLTSDADDANQSVSIVDRSAVVTSGSAGDTTPNDGLDQITLHVMVTTPSAGSTAKFAVYEDEDAAGAPGDNEVNVDEARTLVSVNTAGPLASIEVSPASQTAAQNTNSGPYTVTLKDAAGRITQLNADRTGGTSESVDITATPTSGTATLTDSSLDAGELDMGTATFKAQGSDIGTVDIDLDGPGSVSAAATLYVVEQATVTDAQVDIVTGADDWDGFGNNGNNDGTPLTTLVRVDQSSIRIDIKGSTPNGTVTLNLDGTGGAGNGITFGGKDTATVSTVLDNQGNGSLTITPDAGTIQEGDQIAISGDFDQTLDFERAEATTIDAPNTVFSAVDGSVDITVTVVDQFGDAVSGGYVTAARSGQNNDTTPQKKAVGADGTVTFTFTDKNAAQGQSDTVTFNHYQDQFAVNPDTPAATTTIKYTATGMGRDFNTRLDGENTEATDYDAADVTVVPLADAVDDAADDSADITLTGAEASTPVKLSTDNGALILEPTETKLSEASDSVTAKTLPTGQLPTGYRVVGTKSGVANLTVTSANRTETASFTVGADDLAFNARNLSVSGPAEVENGTAQVTYNAVVTDAFGNPVEGVSVNQLNVQVSGPGQLQDSEAMTDENGVVELNVRLDDDAEGVLTVKVTGLPSASFQQTQFGAAEDRLTSDSKTDNAEGLPASMNEATATTTVKAPVIKKTNPALVVKGRGHRGGDDKVIANAIRRAAGATAELYKKTKHGKKMIGTAILNDKGNAHWKVADKNGKKKTTYKVHVTATDLTKKGHGGTRLR